MLWKLYVKISTNPSKAGRPGPIGMAMGPGRRNKRFKGKREGSIVSKTSPSHLLPYL
jgi:hypothetical protein